MATIPEKIETWQMVQPTAKNKDTGEVTPGKLAKASIPVPTLGTRRCTGQSGWVWRLPYGSGLLL